MPAAPTLLALATALALSAYGVSAAPAVEQDATLPVEPSALRQDSLRLLDRARDAQTRFERDRRRHVPRARSSWGGSCDEIVGRMCMRMDGGDDWWPGEESAELVEARERMLATLTEVRGGIPGDGWVLGQLVVYLIEAGRLEEARAELVRCGPDPWWCDALAGLVLHSSGDYLNAELRFDRSLAAMPSEVRRRWTDLEWVLPTEALDRWKESRDDPARREGFIREYRAASDPFLLVEGNDLWTEFLSRRVQARTRRDARNGYGLRWGDDLEELLIRYGWEIGWERIDPGGSVVTGVPGAVGHHHPESRDFAPPASAFVSGRRADADAWNPGSRDRPRTGYAPAYAPRVTPPDIRMRRLSRGDGDLVVVDLGLPPDTTWHAAHDHSELEVAPRFADRPPEVGVFATPVPSAPEEEGVPVETDGTLPEAPGVRTVGATRSVLLLEVPVGVWVLRAEVLVPDSGRAALHRERIEVLRHPPDLPRISDLLVAPAGDAEPGSLVELVERGILERVSPGSRIAVGWELFGFGLGIGDVELTYEASFARDGGGLLRRAGRFLGLVDDPEPVRLAWSEPAPERVGSAFRSVALTLPPDLEPGSWTLEVRVSLPGRTNLVARSRIEVLPAR